MNIDLVAKKYKRSLENEKLINTESYKRIKAEKLAILARKEREKTLNGLKPNFSLDEDLIEGRAYLRLFEELETSVSKKELWAKQLKDSGIAL